MNEDILTRPFNHRLQIHETDQETKLKKIEKKTFETKLLSAGETQHKKLPTIFVLPFS